LGGKKKNRLQQTLHLRTFDIKCKPIVQLLEVERDAPVGQVAMLKLVDVVEVGRLYPSVA